MKNNFYYSFEEIYPTLTADEIKEKKDEIHKKMSMVKKFKEVFPDYLFSLSFFESSFKFGDFFTKEMATYFSELSYYKGDPSNFFGYISFIKGSLYGYYSFNTELSRHSEISSTLPKKCLSFAKEMTKENKAINVPNFEGFLDDIFRHSSKLEYYTEVMDNGLYKYFSTTRRREIAQTIILESPRATEFLSEFEEFSQLFPMILLNDLVLDVDKSSIIGKYYQKKNIHLYENVIRKKLFSFNILIPFIDGTVINNRRITDKIGGVQNILHRFIFKNKDKYDLPSGAVEFIERYRAYIPPYVLIEEYNLSNTNTGVISLFGTAYVKNLPIKEQLRLATDKISVFGEELRHQSYGTLYNKIQVEINDESEREEMLHSLNLFTLEIANTGSQSALLHLFSKNFKTEGKELFLNILNDEKYAEIVNRLLFTYDANPRYISDGDSMDLFKILVEGLNPEKLSLINLLRKDEAESLLMCGIKTVSYYNTVFTTVARIVQIFKLTDKAPFAKKFVYDALFTYYKKNPDEVFSTLTELVQTSSFNGGLSGYSAWGTLPGLTESETNIYRKSFTKTELLEAFLQPMVDFLDDYGDIETRDKLSGMMQELSLILNL